VSHQTIRGLYRYKEINSNYESNSNYAYRCSLIKNGQKAQVGCESINNLVL
jgi:hypothetical protein